MEVEEFLLDRMMGGLRSPSGRGGEEKDPIIVPCQELNPCCSTRSLVTILTDLSRLLII